MDTATNIMQRLFSSYDGAGTAEVDEVLFDFDPDSNPSMRLFCNSKTVSASKTFKDGAYHHLAATYDNGAVKLYLDGEQVGSGTAGAGEVRLARNVQVGEDTGAWGNPEQLFGDVDDIVLLHEALSAEEIVSLKTTGARRFFNLPLQGTLIRVQ